MSRSSIPDNKAFKGGDMNAAGVGAAKGATFLAGSLRLERRGLIFKTVVDRLNPGDFTAHG